MRLLDALSARTAPDQVSTEQRFGNQFIFDGNRYIFGADGSSPDRVDNNFVSYVENIHSKHGVVAAAVAARSLLLSQVRFKFRRVDGSLYGTPALAPLERPGSYTRPEFLSRLEHDVSYSGTALVGRRGDRLFRLAPDRTTFILGSNSDPSWDGDDVIPPYDAEVIGLAYRPQARTGAADLFFEGEFAVWAPDPDPVHFWRGQSWVTSVMREILIDGQVTDHEGKFFEKAATPGLVFMMDPSRTPDEIKAYQETVDRKFAGTGNAYKNMFLGGATDVKVVGSAMTDLGLGDLQGTFENRVAVRSRIPAVVLGTKEALSGSSLNAGNYSAARRMLADGWFTPTVDNLCAAFESIVPPPRDGSELSFDPSRVLFLQEDQKDAADITQTNSVAMRQLVEAGFEPKTVVDAVTTGDMTKLTHTGNVSVQLQPPGSGASDPNRSQRSADSQQLPLFNVHNYLPESRDIVVPAPDVHVAGASVHVDAPVVNVPEQRMDAPQVTVMVEPTPVRIDNNVDVSPTPVTIENNNRVDVAPAKVPPAQVTVMPAESDGPSTYKVNRDRDGRITEVVEKE